jgi:hypothetical protein
MTHRQQLQLLRGIRVRRGQRPVGRGLAAVAAHGDKNNNANGHCESDAELQQRSSLQTWLLAIEQRRRGIIRGPIDGGCECRNARLGSTIVCTRDPPGVGRCRNGYDNSSD